MPQMGQTWHIHQVDYLVTAAPQRGAGFSAVCGNGTLKSLGATVWGRGKSREDEIEKQVFDNCSCPSICDARACRPDIRGQHGLAGLVEDRRSSLRIGPFAARRGGDCCHRFPSLLDVGEGDAQSIPRGGGRHFTSGGGHLPM